MGIMKLLVVEDDHEMGRLLERGLAAEGYQVTLLDNGMDALIAAANTEFAAATIDVMLPGMSGFEICRHLRQAGNVVPVLLLTAMGAVDDRVFGLDSGADDYLTKPFAFAELSARIRAMVRREATTTRRPLSVGALTIDPHEYRARAGDRELSLSPKEFLLLRLFAGNPGAILSRATILEDIWGSPEHIDPNIVDQYISYLRKKLDASGAGVRIVTARGAGYYLDVPASPDAMAAEPAAGAAAGTE